MGKRRSIQLLSMQTPLRQVPVHDRDEAIVVVTLVAACSATSDVRAATADACKQCSDFRKRCMKNYPGPTCKVDYDICMKSCRKK